VVPQLFDSELSELAQPHHFIGGDPAFSSEAA